MCANTIGDDEVRRESSRRFRSFQAGSTLWKTPGVSPTPYQPIPKPSPFVVSAPSLRVEALVDQGVLRLEEQLLDQHRGAGVREPSTHPSTPSLVVETCGGRPVVDGRLLLFQLR